MCERARAEPLSSAWSLFTAGTSPPTPGPSKAQAQAPPRAEMGWGLLDTLDQLVLQKLPLLTEGCRGEMLAWPYQNSS